MTGTLILVLLSLYIPVLFVVAWRADRQHSSREGPRRRAIIYGLSIAVYFTSWTYYGAVGTAARTGWQYLPIYLGPIIAITLFYPLWRKIAIAAKRENVGSIADFLASRYGKNHALGTVVAFVTLVGTMPYIALQLKSLSMAWVMASGRAEYSGLAVPVIAVILAGFAILFGARRPVLTEHSRGLVRVVALESLVKLAALATVAILGIAIAWKSVRLGSLASHLGLLAEPPHLDITFVNATLLSFAAILCLPRQFYVGFVELENSNDLKTARWLLPAYLILTSLMVIPILAAGSIILSGDSKNPDMYVLEIMIQFGKPLLTAFVFLGGFSAAAAMVTVETVALSGMVSNELVLPVLARSRWRIDPALNVGKIIVNVRRGAIALILFFGWLYCSAIDQGEALGQLGLTSFAAVAQLLPALVGAVVWRRGHARGAIWGICAGFAVWLVAVALPQLMPQNFHGGWINFVPAVLISLGLNLALYIGMSISARPRLIDRIQSDAFIEMSIPRSGVDGSWDLHGTVKDLKSLVSQFIGRQDATKAFEQLGRENGRQLHDVDPIDPALARAAERMLAGAIGAALARSVIGWQLAPKGEETDNVMRALDQAAQAVQFNRELLHATLDNLNQGVCVVDADLRLVAWNKRYIELFEFPPGFIHVGKPIGKVIEFGALKAGFPPDEIEEQVQRRLRHIRRRQIHYFERDRPNGTVLKIVGAPMSGRRYVTSYTDVTELRHAARALANANEQLELRVASRTQELTKAVQELAAAKALAERATNSQARFLAAASHDVLQPLQAARLFIATATDEKKEENAWANDLLSHADLAIESADRLLRALLNLSRLEVGGVRPEVRPVDVHLLMQELHREFSLLASEKGITLRLAATQLWVLSDPDLLLSVLQNLVGNAIRYTRAGGVLVGCRRDAQGVRLEVRDSGPGIPEFALHTIFDEFSRLPEGVETGPGAGLGLSIAERVCKVLNHKLTVRSRLGEGSIFAVTVPRADVQVWRSAIGVPGKLPGGFRILCVENDLSVLHSIEVLLVRWGATVSTATSMKDALALHGDWEIVLADYKLENDGNGLDLIDAMRTRASVFALLTANPEESVIERAANLGVEVIRKPVSPLFLRAFLARALYAVSADT